MENEEKLRIFASNRRAQGQGFACEVSAGSIGHNPGRAAFPAPRVLVFFFFFSFSPLYIWESLKAKLPEDTHKS